MIFQNLRTRIKPPFMLLILLVLFLQSCPPTKTNAEDFASKRNAMVANQLIRRGISDPAVIRAMKKVERHQFVPEKYRIEAYEDYPLPIGFDQTISQPYIVALMTETLGLKGNEKILEIGTGSGYQAAILAEICHSVFTVEILDELGENADMTLKRLGYKNVRVKIGDGYQGWEEHAPYDAIIVTCAPTHIPPELIRQLKENGKMIIPVGESRKQELILLVKTRNGLNAKSVIPVRFVPMTRPNGKTY
ncbi:MAG: protein-L-isoaspartate(D-aspartate) O-methyltransferase [Candidatus Neomarinimicrobiota bacterium]